MSDLDREREQRRLERDRRRRERGRPTFFEAPPLGRAGPDDPTAVLRPDELQPPRDSETDQFTTAETTIIPPAETAARGSVEQPRRLAVSTAIFAVATGISRVLGLVREVVAAYYFGASGPINAFTVAFQVPNLVRALVADAALSTRLRARVQRPAENAIRSARGASRRGCSG